jgi:hypothetical protein
MIKCYFCQKEFLWNVWKATYDCVSCASSYQLERVASTFTRNTRKEYELLYAHIFFDKWHIRFHIKDNETWIEPELATKRIAKLNGFPINLSNAREKLKLCLAFQ